MWRIGAVTRITRVTGVCALLLVIAGAAASSAGAVSRTRADRLAVRALHPAGGAVVFGLPSPVPAGSALLQEGPGAFAVGRGSLRQQEGDERLTWRVRPARLSRRAWLFWEDLAPGALFAHSSVLLALDAASGRVVLRKVLDWAPLVNGRRPVFLSSRAVYQSPRYRIYSPPAARVAASRGGFQALPALASNLDLSGVCLVAVGATGEPLLKGDFGAVRSLAKSLHVPLLVAETGSELRLALDNPRRSCKHVTLFVLGHGIPPSGPAADGGLMNPIASLFLPSDPCVMLNRTQDVGTKSGQHLLCAPELRGIVASHPTTTFDVEIESCYAGRWVPPLSGAGNVASIGVAAGARRYAYWYTNGSSSDFTRSVTDAVLDWANDPQAVSQTKGNITAALERGDADYGLSHVDREPEYYDSVHGEIVSFDTAHPEGQYLQVNGGGQTNPNTPNPSTPNPNTPQGPSPGPAPLPPSRIPRGTVTLKQTWTLSQPPPPGTQHTITASCSATLTYNGSRTVAVDETYSWKEQVSQSGRTSTTTRTGQFHGSGQSDGAPLTFGRDFFGNVTYSFSVFTAQELMPVNETIVSTPPSQTYNNKYQSSCWNEDPTRSTPATLSGTASSSGHTAGTIDQTVDGSQYRAHHVMTWTLDP